MVNYYNSPCHGKLPLSPSEGPFRKLPGEIDMVARLKVKMECVQQWQGVLADLHCFVFLGVHLAGGWGAFRR